MNYLKPVYTLKLSTVHCGYRLAINGCLLDVNKTGESFNMEYPINQWIRDGANQIDIYLLNIRMKRKGRNLHEEGKLILELCVKEHESDQKMVISRTVYDGTQITRKENGILTDYDNTASLNASVAESSKPGSFNIVDGRLVEDEMGVLKFGAYTLEKGLHNKALHISQPITLSAPFPEWRFFNADDLPFHADLTDEEWEETRKQLIEVYQPVWQALKDKDMKAIKTLFAARGKEYDQAFYKLDGQDLHEMRVHLNGIAHDKDRVLQPLKFNNVDVCVSYNNKVTWLHHPKASLASSLKFRFTTAEIETRVPIFWARFDGQWEIVR